MHRVSVEGAAQHKSYDLLYIFRITITAVWSVYTCDGWFAEMRRICEYRNEGFKKNQVNIKPTDLSTVNMESRNSVMNVSVMFYAWKAESRFNFLFGSCSAPASHQCRLLCLLPWRLTNNAHYRHLVVQSANRTRSLNHYLKQSKPNAQFKSSSSPPLHLLPTSGSFYYYF